MLLTRSSCTDSLVRSAAKPPFNKLSCKSHRDLRLRSTPKKACSSSAVTVASASACSLQDKLAQSIHALQAHGLVDAQDAVPFQNGGLLLDSTADCCCCFLLLAAASLFALFLFGRRFQLLPLHQSLPATVWALPEAGSAPPAIVLRPRRVGVMASCWSWYKRLRASSLLRGGGGVLLLLLLCWSGAATSGCRCCCRRTILQVGKITKASDDSDERAWVRRTARTTRVEERHETLRRRHS